MASILSCSVSKFAVQRLNSKANPTILQNALAKNQAVPLGRGTLLKVGAKAALEIGLVHFVLLLFYGMFH